MACYSKDCAWGDCSVCDHCEKALLADCKSELVAATKQLVKDDAELAKLREENQRLDKMLKKLCGKGPSGCACVIGEDGEEIKRRCMAHKLDRDQAKIEVLEEVLAAYLDDGNWVVPSKPELKAGQIVEAKLKQLKKEDQRCPPDKQ